MGERWGAHRIGMEKVWVAQNIGGEEVGTAHARVLWYPHVLHIRALKYSGLSHAEVLLYLYHCRMRTFAPADPVATGGRSGLIWG